MRQIISNNTGKAPEVLHKTDIQVDGDGEGGIFVSLCWHEMKELGSIAVHLPPEKARLLIEAIQIASCEFDDD